MYVVAGRGSRDWAGLAGAVPHLERRKVELSGRVPELVACCVGAPPYMAEGRFVFDVSLIQ